MVALRFARLFFMPKYIGNLPVAGFLHEKE
jgi:hypothetical protein